MQKTKNHKQTKPTCRTSCMRAELLTSGIAMASVDSRNGKAAASGDSLLLSAANFYENKRQKTKDSNGAGGGFSA